MNTATVIAVIVLVLIISLAAAYIIKEKRRGVKCIGCPFADQCTKYGSPKEKHKSFKNIREA